MAEKNDISALKSLLSESNASTLQAAIKELKQLEEEERAYEASCGSDEKERNLNSTMAKIDNTTTVEYDVSTLNKTEMLQEELRIRKVIREKLKAKLDRSKAEKEAMLKEKEMVERRESERRTLVYKRATQLVEKEVRKQEWKIRRNNAEYKNLLAEKEAFLRKIDTNVENLIQTSPIRT